MKIFEAIYKIATNSRRIVDQNLEIMKTLRSIDSRLKNMDKTPEW